MNDDCVFCKIIEGDLPSHKIYETDDLIAFLDAEPVSKGHALVVPKKHVETIHEAHDMDYMWNGIVKVSTAVKDAFNAEGVNVEQNNGEVAGQEVMHMHFHITPRYTGEEIEIEYDRTELKSGEKLAEEIRSEI
ncbi:MAG: HIT family protein [Nanohaloarchaea archaeon]|nr:HIT family protein [Candidatus Nanohaloarchaea archaeon]